jgi:F0F1-type ATP synthase delta subunit
VTQLSGLAEVLAENNRLDQLDKISDVFDDIMAAVRGEVKATITTAEVNDEHARCCGQK